MTDVQESAVTPVDDPAPKTVATTHGPVEFVAVWEGPAVLAVHGAMGGYDQGVILARAIGAPGYRHVAVSRPGYLGAPLTAGQTPEEQADCCAAILDALGIAAAAVMAVSGGGPCAGQFTLRHRARCWGLVLVATDVEQGYIDFAAGNGSPALGRRPRATH